MMWDVMSTPYPVDPLDPLEWAGRMITVVFGLGMMVVGTCNVVSVHVALVANRRLQRVAFNFGLVSCFTLGITVMLLMGSSGRLLWLIPSAAAVVLTAASLRLVRPDPHPAWLCPKCGYDLRGLEGGGDKIVCPECGSAKGEG